MPHPFFAASRPLVFAHRGGAALAPENTIAAFDHAAALGVDGLELDVHLSRDGIVVVHHDRTLDRTTALSGLVAARTADELGRAGVPVLENVLQRYRDVRVIVELKVNDCALAKAAVATVRRAGAVERVCFGAFGSAVLRAVRRMEPALATSASREEVRLAVYRAWCRWPVSHPAYDGYQVPEQTRTTRVVFPRFVQYAHDAGLGVQVWTINNERDAERLLEWGVDALITDRPDLLLPVCRNRR